MKDKLAQRKNYRQITQIRGQTKRGQWSQLEKAGKQFSSTDLSYFYGDKSSAPTKDYFCIKLSNNKINFLKETVS